MSAFPQFGLNYPGLSVTQMMAGSAMQPGVHTPSCDVAHARPIMSDPCTGQTICSCQYDRFVRSCLPAGVTVGAPGNLNNAPPAFSPFPLPPNGDHPPPPGMPPFMPGSLPPPMNGPHDNMPLFPGGLLPPGFPDLKEMAGDPGAAVAFRAAMMAQSGAAGCYPYEPPFGGGMYASGPYCGSNYAMDPAGLNRRKNATRETTSQLKQWLSEHRKNPYPTKGEKIMLAIMTKMTLTQVSTWFANARRRLKKENKMTWSPRNRGCEDDDKSDGENDGNESGDEFLAIDKDDGSLSEISSLTDDNGLKRTTSVSPRDTKDSQPNQAALLPASGCAPAGSVDGVNAATGNNTLNGSVNTAKPRIWSLADMAGPGNASPNKTQLAPPPDALPAPPLPLPFPHGPPHHPSGHPFLRMGPMLPPGAHPGGWSPLFAASAAGSLLQSGALNAQHAAAANFFTQNPNSAFSAPGRMPPGLMGANGMVHPRLPVNAGQRENVVSRSKEDGVETNGALAPPTKTHRTSPSENVRVAQKSPDGSSVKKPEKLISVTVSRNLSNSDSTKLTERLENSPPNSSEPSAKRRKSDSSDSRPLSPSV